MSRAAVAEQARPSAGAVRRVRTPGMRFRLRSGGRDSADIAPVLNAHDAACILYTSGTTGRRRA